MCLKIVDVTYNDEIRNKIKDKYWNIINKILYTSSQSFDHEYFMMKIK